MPVAWDIPLQALTHPTSIAFRPEEHRAVVAVNAHHLEALVGEEDGYLRPNQATGASYKCAFCHGSFLGLTEGP
jgi:hypothetical protein